MKIGNFRSLVANLFILQAKPSTNMKEKTTTKTVILSSTQRNAPFASSR